MAATQPDRAATKPSTREGTQQLLARAVAAWHSQLSDRGTVAGLRVTAPQDRVRFPLKLAYGAGALANNTLAAAIGGMMLVLNLGLGMNPALVGLLAALPRLYDALIDPVMGFVSDHARTRWGRRRPFIFAGAIAAGLIYPVLWWFPPDGSEAFTFWYFLAVSVLFYSAYTVYATPWVALGYELTADSDERTRLMGVQNFIGQLAYLISPWFLWFMSNRDWFPDQLRGARWLAVIIGASTLVLGILPAIFLRERPLPPRAVVSTPKRNLGDTVKAFGHGMHSALSSGPFLKLCAATFLVFNGFNLISSFQSYVIIFHVFGGDQVRGAEYAGYSGTLGAVSTFGVIVLVTWLATKIGKRRAFFFSTGVSMVGYAAKWLCYDPRYPWLLLVPAPFMAFGLGGLFTVMGSMIADVVDVDELKTHERREGVFGSLFWWVVKLGMAASLAGGGFLLNATGFDAALLAAQAPGSITLMRACDAFIPVIASFIAILAVWSYPVTEDVARAVRFELEQRRLATTSEPG